MEQQVNFEQFSLFGGRLHRLGEPLRLANGNRSAFALGLALGLLTWSILLALAIIDGVVPKLLSLPVIAAHVRLLVVIPLLFLCETLLESRLRQFVGLIVRFGVVPEHALPALRSEIARTGRWREFFASGNNMPAGDSAVDRVRGAVSPVG